MRLKADLLLFLVAFIWGTGFVAQGVAAQYNVAYLFNGVSFMLAALILIPFIPKAVFATHLPWRAVPGESTEQKRISQRSLWTLWLPKQQWKWMFIAGGILFFATAFQQVLRRTRVA